MVRIFGTLILVLMILLFPPTALALISNNAVPGDITYPIKRGLEVGILKITSVNSTSKVWFTTERSNRRFIEATTLISAKKEEEAIKSLNELVIQTKEAAKEVKKIEGDVTRIELKKKLASQIKKYDTELKKIENELREETGPTPRGTSPTPTRSQVSPPTINPSVTPTVGTRQPTVTPTQVPLPTNIRPSPTIIPTPIPLANPEVPCQGQLVNVLHCVGQIIDEEEQNLQQGDNRNSFESMASVPTDIPSQADQEPTIPSPTLEPTAEPTPNLQFIIPTGSFTKNVNTIPTPTDSQFISCSVCNADVFDEGNGKVSDKDLSLLEKCEYFKSLSIVDLDAKACQKMDVNGNDSIEIIEISCARSKLNQICVQ